MPGNSDPIVREIYIDALPETVFEFFVDPDKLTRWLAVEARLDPRPGGECVQLHDADDGGVPHGRFCHMQGQFLEVDPPTRVVFTWGFTETEVGVPPGSSTVEVTLRAVAGGTQLRLVHHDLPPAELDNHAGGWTEMLDRLARVIIKNER